MSSRGRLGVCRLLFVTLTVILPSLVVTFRSSDSEAQSFLLCERSKSDSQLENGAHPQWVYDSQGILHAFAGDDLKAYFGFHPRIEVIDRKLPNAFALTPGHIVVSAGLLELTSSSSEFAFVLAHELGHLLLQRGEDVHTFANLQPEVDHRLAAEFAADAYAMRLLKNRGFDSTAGVAVLRRIADTAQSAGASSTALFPSIEARIVAMAKASGSPRL